MAAQASSVLRSLIFYIVFYGGSIFIVLASLAAMPFSPRIFRIAVESWSGYHRICAKWLLGIHVRVEGTLPSGPVLVALKHESFFEAIDLPHLLDHPSVFAKAELLRIPFWGPAAIGYGLVGVERDQGAKALRTMVSAARVHAAAGRPLAIFPEGTRIAHGNQPQLQSGFAGLYKLLALPVVPIAIDSGALYHRRWKRKGTVTYRVGETIPPGLPRADVEARVHTAINALNDGPKT